MKKHSFEFPADQLGRPGAVKAYRGNKNDYVTPVADLSGMAELLTNTPLEAIEVYSQFGQDRLGAVLIDRAQGWAYSDRSGTLFIEESEDNNSWTASHSVAVKGGVLTASGWVSLTKRYYRFRFENGNQKQSEFVLYQSVGTGGDMAFSYTDVIFHENAAEAGEGSIFSAGAWKKLLVEITGTAESGRVAFWGRSISGKNVPIRGIRSDDGTSAAGTSGTEEVWSFDIAGFKEIVMEIKSISGGSLSVKGTAFS
ncbi:phage portal protein [Bacillus velezensis]|uniref:phage portal protein n=1 Tax=Bacillus amyloliquefaciens group TaxID=1938374 RepID=UPI0023E27DFB|nr:MULTISPECIES: phage portal protein [Bacillus amyloliquefaciens group]MEC3676386.1 phage portal protein [Bacillus velezensis]WES00298.1 phage portal protein [Bacillus velezensis]WOH97713.1 phage portal protein [Bacillus amyloliquefaciens]WOI50419.1 phage portal protein [Bacillus amyloliquefaciens]WOI66328.1 phage portal protein [Bacillus amyloliquefaciens]